MHASLLLQDYIDSYAARGITLDDFQVEACSALGEGEDVLVCAPTGAGKTVVAHFGVNLALASSTRCIYTAPIKALSNQKYTELLTRVGKENVGLLTGDETLNRDAPILVVTTEVLRNMLLHQAPEIAQIGYVVLDEVHFLADRERGPVWEEVILSLPENIRLISLSATIANYGEILEWLESVRGSTRLVVSSHRPVPLRQHVLVGSKLPPLYGSEREPSTALVAALRRLSERSTRTPGGASPRLTGRDRRRIIRVLEKADMLPAIEFIFSRKGCDLAVRDLLRAGVTLTTVTQREEISRRIDALAATLSPSDRRVIRFDEARTALLAGYGAHHAGILPAMKTLTEELMAAGLLRLVYATGTLALGIDMPVRSVVLEELRRFDGEGFVDLSATEYTQLIGRAGRRGKDEVGHAIVVGTPDLDPWALASLGSGEVEPLLSAFQPSYNTVINLLAERSYDEARSLMGASLAQFQRNADVGHIEATAAKVRRRRAHEENTLQCSHGDILEYVRLRKAAGRASKSARKAAKREYAHQIARSFERAQTGRIYAFSLAGELTYALTLSVEETRLRLLTVEGERRWLRLSQLSSPLREIGEFELPLGISMRSSSGREHVADLIVDDVAERMELGLDSDLLESWSRFAPPREERINSHPCASCPHIDRHLHEAGTLLALDSHLAELNEQAASYTDSVGRDFDRTAEVLTEVGLLTAQGELRPGARVLRELHVDTDLLLYQALTGLDEGRLEAGEFAGWASMFLADDRLGSAFPRHRVLVEEARRVRAQAEAIRAIEMQHHILRTQDITPGCADIFELWAHGGSLEECVQLSRLAPGDFMSAARRLIDLLGQIAVAGEGTWIEELAREARSSMRRSEVL